MNALGRGFVKTKGRKRRLVGLFGRERSQVSYMIDGKEDLQLTQTTDKP